MVKPQGETPPFSGQSMNNRHNVPGSLRAIRFTLVALAVVCTVAPAMAQAPPILRQVPEGSPLPRLLPPAPPPGRARSPSARRSGSRGPVAKDALPWATT